MTQQVKHDLTFSIGDTIYHQFPSIDQFVEEAGLDQGTIKKRLLTRLENFGIDDISQLFIYNRIQMELELGISKRDAKLLSTHLSRLRRRGDLVVTAKEIHNDFRYLTSSNTEIDRTLTNPDGYTGFRSRSIVEIYGEAGIGKTQMLMTLSCMCLREKNKGGWGQKVVYIDSEGSFDVSRFKQLATFWGIDPQIVDTHLYISRVYNFDEVEAALIRTAKLANNEDIGLIVVDSIIDPLKAQYPLGDDLTLLQPRQQHLKQVTDLMKGVAQLHDILVCFSNQVRSAMDENQFDKVVPQGGNVLAHASDIRIWLHSPQTEFGLHKAVFEIKDCGWLPTGSAEYFYGAFGISDPTRLDKVRKFNEINMGSKLLVQEIKSEEENIEDTLKELQDQLY